MYWSTVGWVSYTGWTGPATHVTTENMDLRAGPVSLEQWSWPTSGSLAAITLDCGSLNFKRFDGAWVLGIPMVLTFLHQHFAASSWWCSPRPSTDWVEMAGQNPRGVLPNCYPLILFIRRRDTVFPNMAFLLQFLTEVFLGEKKSLF